MKIGETRKQQAALAETDAKILEILYEELRNFNWVVESGGGDGQIELDRAREIARDAIKVIVNYL